MSESPPTYGSYNDGLDDAEKRVIAFRNARDEMEKTERRRKKRNDQDSAAEPALTALCYRQMSAIKAKPVDWFWYPYIPRRANTLFTGDSDVGKSKAMASIISMATHGGSLPLSGAEIAPGNVIILSAEEDAETMLKPSLLAAGADCDRIFLVDSCAEYDAQGRMQRRLVTMEKDVTQLKLLAGKLGNVSLAVIDPITAYLGTRISGNDNTAIRAVLSDLQTLAEEYGNANLLTTHFGKDNTRTAKLMVLGSVAFVAGVRSVIGIFRDPVDTTSQRRLMIPVKCNLVPDADRVGMAFEIVGAEVFDGDTTPIATASVRWFNERIDQKPDAILAAIRAATLTTDAGNPRLDPARQRIIDVIRAAGHPLGAKQIAERLEGEEIPDWNDQRRTRIRKLLAKMLADEQVEQSWESKRYSLPTTTLSTTTTTTTTHTTHSNHSTHSSNSNHSSHSDKICDLLPLSPVLTVPHVPAVPTVTAVPTVNAVNAVTANNAEQPSAPVFTRFTFYLNTGGQQEFRSATAITLAIATVAGRRQYGTAFAYAEGNLEG